MRRRHIKEETDVTALDREALEALYARALDAAARQLSYRALSASALREKLTGEGYPEEAVSYAMAYLTEHGFLDDERFAESAVRSYTRRGYAAMADYERERAAIRALLEKRLHGDLSDRKEVQKAVAALQRRGFLWEDIRRALNEYGAEIDAEFD